MSKSLSKVIKILKLTVSIISFRLNWIAEIWTNTNERQMWNLARSWTNRINNHKQWKQITKARTCLFESPFLVRSEILQPRICLPLVGLGKYMSKCQEEAMNTDQTVKMSVEMLCYQNRRHKHRMCWWSCTRIAQKDPWEHIVKLSCSIKLNKHIITTALYCTVLVEHCIIGILFWPRLYDSQRP